MAISHPCAARSGCRRGLSTSLGISAELPPIPARGSTRPKIIRPAGVCNTLVTAMITSCPMCARPLFDHHHRAVIEIADALADLVAGLDDLDRQRFARQRDRLQRVGHLIQVDDLDARATARSCSD